MFYILLYLLLDAIFIAKIREQAERGTPGGRALSLGSLPKMYRLAKPIIIKPILRKASPKAGSSGM